MEAVNGVSDVDKGGPTAPSPLTGCYLLIVVGEPHSQEHKDIILRRIAKGLLSWDASDCYVDLEKELAIINEQAPEGEDARYGERLIQFASENLVTEILIHPAISTLSQCMKNLLSSFTRHRHIIHSGYTFAANGSWILQDGTFSLSDFSEAFQEIEVQRILRAYDNSISLDIHCSPEGDWTRLPKDSFTKNCKVRINPDDVLTSGSPSIANFLNYISPFLIPTDIETLLESSDVVGNIRFSHPTLYVFPGGQGDAALFGINGFNMLVDGGFARKACFWDFVRHLDRLDAVLLTRLNNSNVNGISSILRRKKFNTVYPQIGHFFCNIQERKAILSPDGDKDKDPLLISLLEEGQELINNLRQLNLQPQVCYRDVEPINLYHKVGHGTLDMYVISPARDSKEVRDFLQKWNNNDQRLFANQRSGKDFTFPIQNLISICALLVWQPASASDNITRILFPGSTPQHKIFEGLDRLKQLECIKYPSCSAKTLAPTIKSKQTKTEKFLQEQKDFKPKLEGKIKDEIIKNGHANGFVTDNLITNKIKKHDSTESEKSGPKSLDIKKTEDKKEMEKSAEEKTKLKAKMDQKPKIDPRGLKHSRSIERKPKSIVDKKPSPTTPKKTIDAKTNGEVAKTRVKTSPTTTPAKSTKEANNRKVVESKYKTTTKKEVSKVEKRDMKERRPVTRKPAESSPSRKVFESPVRKLPDLQKVESRKAKIEKEGTTDSSTVSTPSADADASLKKDISKLTPEELEQLKDRELAELKEEQEVVNEIEAVFRKSEKKVASDSDLRKVKSISMEDKTEGEEYLIVEKEVIDQDSLDEKEHKECETQKHLRDSEESEKQRKMSDEAVETKETVETKLQDEKTPPTADIAKVVETKDVPKESSTVSPDEKMDVSSGKKIDRDQDDDNRENNLIESQPDEKHSTPIESGATTAPTLPEDERIPLDEIKEDNGDQVIVEKYVKETKEKEIPVVQLPPAPTETVNKLPTIVGIRLDKQTPIRDLVKTPDEVADLPVHEVVDSDNYEQYQTTQNEHLGVVKSPPKETKSSEEPMEEKIEVPGNEQNGTVEKSDTAKETINTEVIKDTVTKVTTEVVEEAAHVEITEETVTKVTTEIVEEKTIETLDEKSDVKHSDVIKDENQVDHTQKLDEEAKGSVEETVKKVTETVEGHIEPVKEDAAEIERKTETVVETTTHVVSEVVSKFEVEEKEVEKDDAEKQEAAELGDTKEKTIEKESATEEKQEDITDTEDTKKEETGKDEDVTEKQSVEFAEKHSEVVTKEFETETSQQIVHKTKETNETITATEEVKHKEDVTVVTTTEKIESHTEEVVKETKVEKESIQPEEEDTATKLDEKIDNEDEKKVVTTTEVTETIEKIELEETVAKSDSPISTAILSEVEDKKEIKTEKIVEETKIEHDKPVKTESITTETKEIKKSHVEKGDIEKEICEDDSDQVKESAAVKASSEKDTHTKTPEKVTESPQAGKPHETKVKLPEESKIVDAIDDVLDFAPPHSEEGFIKDVEESLEDAKTAVHVTKHEVTEQTIVEKSIGQELLEAHKDIEDQKEEPNKTVTEVVEKTEETIKHVEEKVTSIETKAVEEVEQVISKIDKKVEEVAVKVEEKATATATKVEEHVTESITKVEDQVVEVKSTLEDKVVEIKSKVEEHAKETVTVAEETIDEIKSKIEAAKEAVTIVPHKAEELAEKIIETSEKTVTQVDERVKDVKSNMEASIETVTEVKEKMEGKVIEGAAKVEEKVIEGVAKVEDKVEELKSKVEESVEAVSEVKEKLEDKATKAAEEVEDKVKDFKSQLQESIAPVAELKENIEEKLAKTVGKIEDKVEDVKSEIKESIETAADVKEKIEEKVADTVAKVEDRVEDVKSKIQESVKPAADIKDEIEQKVAETVAKVEEKVEETKSQVETKVTETAAKIDKQADEIKSVVEEKVSAVEEKVKESVAEAKEHAAGIVSEVKDKAAETVTKTQDNITATLDLVEEKAEELKPKVGMKVAEAIAKVDDKLKKAADKVEEVVTETETKIEEKKEEIGEALKAAEEKSKHTIADLEEKISKIIPESIIGKKMQDDIVPEVITKKEAQLVEAVTIQKEEMKPSTPEDNKIVPPSEDILSSIEAQVIGAIGTAKEEKDTKKQNIVNETTLKDEIGTENIEEIISKINIDYQSSENAHKDEKLTLGEEIGKISAKPLELLEDKIKDLHPQEIKPIKISVIEENLIDSSEKDVSEEKIVINYVLEDAKEIEKIDKELQELKEASDIEAQNKIELDLVDKMELGRKSPKEREQDVAIIVASVAEVLKSDAPLEEFEGKIPLEISFETYPPYTTELRETHITTVDSPMCDKNVSDKLQMRAIEEEAIKDPVTAFLNEERKVTSIHGESNRATDLIKDSAELMQATSKIISDIKQTSKSEDFIIIEDSRDTVLPSIIEKPLEETDVVFELCRKQSTTSSTEEQVSETEEEKVEEIKKIVGSAEKIDSDTHDEKHVKEESEKSIKLEKEPAKSNDSEETVAKRLVESLTETTIALQKDLEKSILDTEETSSHKSTPEPPAKDTLDVAPITSGKSTPETSDLNNGSTPAKSPALSRASTPSIIVMDDKDDKEIILQSAQLEEFEDSTSTVVELKKEEVKNILDLTKEFISIEQISHCLSEKGDKDTTVIDNKASSSSTTKDDASRPKSPEELNISRKSTPDIADVTKTDKLIESLTGKTTPPAVPVSPISKTHTETLQEHMSEVTNHKSNDVRSSTPASDDCDISSGQVSRVLTAKDNFEKDSSDEEDLPGSPLSAMSQVAHSTSSQYDVEDSIHFIPPIDPMSASFYGALPDETTEPKTSDIDFNKALAEHKQTRGEDLVPSGSPSHVYEVTKAKYSSIKVKEGEGSQPQESLMTSSFIGSELPKGDEKDPIASWGKPLGLPSPAPINDNKGTPKKERKIPSNVIAKNKLNEDKKSLDSKYEKKGKKVVPVYMDLTYVPHHGNANYSYVDFFKRVRARYYVFSGIEPSKEVYNALLEAKQTWEEKDLEVTIISTYDTDVLGYWVAENEDLLTKCKIDLSPSASRCTINLQDHETSCSAYRLEFS